MADVTMHIKNWLGKADPDYYTMFIQTWIPLNAWYVHQFNSTKDSVCIEKLKSTRNTIRIRIEALLQNENVDVESRNFRFHLGQLHYQLENRRIENKGSVISFNNLPMDKSDQVNSSTDTDKKGNIFKAVNKESYYQAIIVAKGGKTLMDGKFSEHKIDSLLTHNQYIALGDSEIQEIIRVCFQNIDPNNKISLVTKTRTKSDKIILEEQSKLAFVNDVELISKSLIHVIYQLRCVLFHGNIDPTSTNQKIYEHTFYMLKSIINELH